MGERQVRKLAGSRYAPGDWIQRARMVALSWHGLRAPTIAAELLAELAGGGTAGAGAHRTP